MTNPCAEVFITVEMVLQRYPIRNPIWRCSSDSFWVDKTEIRKQCRELISNDSMHELMDPWYRKISPDYRIHREAGTVNGKITYSSFTTTVSGFKVLCIIKY